MKSLSFAFAVSAYTDEIITVYARHIIVIISVMFGKVAEKGLSHFQTNVEGAIIQAARKFAYILYTIPEV